MGSFSSVYLWSLIKAKKSEIEVIRMGAAGSLTMILVESMFYFVDAVNTRSKVLSENVKFSDMIKDIYKSEGI